MIISCTDDRRSARFLVDESEGRSASDGFPLFESRAECLRWIMENRIELARPAPRPAIVPVNLAAG